MSKRYGKRVWSWVPDWVNTQQNMSFDNCTFHWQDGQNQDWSQLWSTSRDGRRGPPVPLNQQQYSDVWHYLDQQQPMKSQKFFHQGPPARQQKATTPRKPRAQTQPINEMMEMEMFPKQQNSRYKWSSNSSRSVFDRLGARESENNVSGWHEPPIWSPFYQDDYHFDDFPQPPQAEQRFDEQGAGSSGSYSSSSFRKGIKTRYYRRMAKGDPPLRPGMRAFCTYVADRKGKSAKLNAEGRRLQFVYKIKACLWHRTKMGLHKKKTSLGSIANRNRLYRQVMQKYMFCRKVHSQYFTRNVEKPQVCVRTKHLPNLEKCSRDEYMSLVALCTPTSWQEPKHAYFHHFEYQLFLVDPAGLEFASLQNQMNASNFKATQAVRLQNAFLFGAYLSKREQLLAGSKLLAEVIRFFCVKKAQLKVLCKHGFDPRRLSDDLDAHLTPKDAHEHRPETDEEVIMVAARTFVMPIEMRRGENDVYPEYIMQYNYLHSFSF